MRNFLLAAALLFVTCAPLAAQPAEDDDATTPTHPGATHVSVSADYVLTADDKEMRVRDRWTGELRAQLDLPEGRLDTLGWATKNSLDACTLNDKGRRVQYSYSHLSGWRRKFSFPRRLNPLITRQFDGNVKEFALHPTVRSA